jgi:hypothetical protein
MTMMRGYVLLFKGQGRIISEQERIHTDILGLGTSNFVQWMTSFVKSEVMVQGRIITKQGNLACKI